MSEITQLLSPQQGEPNLQQVFERLYPELRKLARARLSSMRDSETLTPTTLIHEAYMRLVRADALDLKGRRHFFACASQVMRNIVVDYLRESGAQKRGGDQVAITLTDNIAGGQDPHHLLELDQALDELDQVSRTQRELVEMKFFGGLTVEEIAELTGTSARTVARQWQQARAFLHARIAAAGN